jgi:hypothetical protein
MLTLALGGGMFAFPAMIAMEAAVACMAVGGVLTAKTVEKPSSSEVPAVSKVLNAGRSQKVASALKETQRQTPPSQAHDVERGRQLSPSQGLAHLRPQKRRRNSLRSLANGLRFQGELFLL